MPEVAASVCVRCGLPLEPAQRECFACGVVRPADGWPEDPRIGRPLYGSLPAISRIGYGFSGSIYRVEDPVTTESFAVKVLHADLARDADVVRRFRLEAAVTKSLNLPQVVKTHESGVLPDGSHFLAMEFIHGTSLDRLLGTQGTLAIEDAVEVTHQLLAALAVAHSRYIVHRDLKPANIILSRTPGGDPLVKILDFGFAKVVSDTNRPSRSAFMRTQGFVILGTPAYMSPEQARGAHDVDSRTDLYSVGVLLYRMLTGALPFESKSAAESANRAADERALPPSARRAGLPQGLDRFVLKFLEPEPANRYASADEALAALERLFPSGEARWTIEELSNRNVRPTVMLEAMGRQMAPPPGETPFLEPRHTPAWVWIGAAVLAGIAVATLYYVLY